MSALKQALGLAVFIVICFAVAGIGSVFTAASIPDWYAGLRKPSFNPPNWIFGPVWTALYLAMAVAAWLVWRRVGLSAAAAPLIVFAIQLALNLLWSILFFGMHRIGLALVDIVALWCAIAATILMFWRVTPAAGWLLIPYLMWVSFASVLNFSIWRMNR